MRDIKVIKKQVEIVEIASFIANWNIFYKFIYAFLYFYSFSRLNISITFKFTNIIKQLLSNLPLLLKLSAKISFLLKCFKSSSLKIYFSIIFCFRVKLDYKSSFNAFILSDNLISIC